MSLEHEGTPDGIIELWAAQWARAYRRPEYFAGSKNPAAAAGRLIGKFLEARNTWATRDDNDTDHHPKPEIVHADLVKVAKKATGITVRTSTICQLLKGDIGHGEEAVKKWLECAKPMFHYILEGKQSFNITDKESCSQRLVRFFFDDHTSANSKGTENGSKNYFFDPDYANFSLPHTTAEATAEVAAVAYYCLKGGIGRLIRVSGYHRFLQCDKKYKTLTESGKLTVEALKTGNVKVFYVFGSDNGAPTPAKESAEAFRRLAAASLNEGHLDAEGKPKNLELVNIDSSMAAIKRDDDKELCFVGEYLTRSMIFAWHECDPRQGKRVPAWKTLLAARHFDFRRKDRNRSADCIRFGPCAYSTGVEDREAFEKWVSCYVAKEEPVASSS